MSEWLADEAHPICALVAMGGMGKSALAWYWVTHDVLPTPTPDPSSPPFGRGLTPAVAGEGGPGLMVMWWSFYEGEASFAKFVDEALKYVGGGEIDAARLALEAGDRAAARQHAETARERAWCDGPPHCYKPALDEAERMLREIP